MVMQATAPGNVDKGYCIKCKVPLLVEVPGQIRFLCPDCVKEVKAIMRDSKSNKNLKRTVLEPGQWRRVLPDGSKMPLVDVKKRLVATVKK